ncbi:hypothetical protein [Mycetocola tolaasinivorans]|uniref:hypothetical protein n=1 Tax=Mycetocola tolaasinivorans TaxID=76635 RepID=UPI0015FF29A1|nr:hypothetical protein [Mycetocola tolaasinivorans]
MKQFWSRIVSSIIQEDDSDLTRLDLIERAHRTDSSAPVSARSAETRVTAGSPG